jgi:hypothetical protein
MVKKQKIWKSLKGRSLEELRVRGAQKLAAATERAGFSSQTRVPSDEAFFRLLDAEARGQLRSAEDLLQHFRTRRRPRFFASFRNPQETVKELRSCFGAEAEAQVIARAEKIMSGRFDLLGFHELSFTDAVDWHLEPVAGRRAPLAHWSRINYLNAEEAGDKKIIWELNRHQYFMTLGRAYWYTSDERYAQRFAEHLSDWMDKNPPKQGINWASSLEVALRSIAWLWALHFFRDSTHLEPQFFLRALKFLYLHARHLETYLSTYFSPNTHLTGEALGLFYLGTVLAEFECAGRWRAVGQRILLGELERHVLSDGVYFERTTYYHRYTTDFYTHLFILLSANDEEAAPLLETKLTALLDHLMHITMPDGRTPRFGDDDGGRLVRLDERPTDDFRAALSTGAALFKRADYKHVAGTLAEETVWLLGQDGAQSFYEVESRAPEQTSRAFSEGGYYLMRDGWAHDANYLLIDCGPHGVMNCGHAHADALSFELAARGRTILVDPGTYTYTGSTELRDIFRASSAHNTLVVDKESSSIPSGPFSWKTTATARRRRWLSLERVDFFEGQHDGYLRMSEPVLHTRSLLFIKNSYWIMLDRALTEGTHLYELPFHFAQGARPRIEEDGKAVASLRAYDEKHAGLEVITFSGGGRWREEEGWVSEAYGARHPAPVCTFAVKGKGHREFVTFMIPQGAGQKSVYVREVEANEARCFEVLSESARDVLLIGAAKVETPLLIESDFEWLWARFNGNADKLEELVLLQGSTLCLDGAEIVKAEESLGYLYVRRAGSDLIVETDASGSLKLNLFGALRLILNNNEFEAHGERIHIKNGQLVLEEGAPEVETFV